MRKMEITGGQVKNFQLSEKGDVGYLTVAATIYKNKAKHSLWICAVLKDKLLENYQNNPITGGINMGGTFDVSSFTDKQNNMHPKIYIILDWYEEAKAYGSGLLRISLSEARLAEDLREKEGVSYAKLAYNYANSDKTLWCDTSFWGDQARNAKAMKLKKGSAVDIDANFDVEINSKDDKQYLNVLLTVNKVAYSALPEKPKDEAPKANSTPAAPTEAAPATTTTPAPQPDTSVAQETTLEEPISGEPGENDFF